MCVHRHILTLIYKEREKEENDTHLHYIFNHEYPQRACNVTQTLTD